MSAPARTRRARLLKLSECSDECGLPVKALLQHVHTGELPARWCGNHYRVLDSAFDAFLASFGEAQDGVT